MRYNIGLKIARLIEERLLAALEEHPGKPIAACILDAHGHQVSAFRQDGAKAASVGFASNKALTVIEFEAPTASFGTFDEATGEWIPGNPVIDANRARTMSSFCGVAGGVPAYSPNSPGPDQLIIASVAVSGRLPHEDHALALEAISDSSVFA